jgi:hypothetical protein
MQFICSSNHTLENVNPSCTSFTSECLKLNRNKNKNIVIQNKVMQFYFVGSFDLAPFASMPLSVLAKVMSVGQAMRNKQTAIFELLRGIAELVNVSGRRTELRQNNRGDKIVFMLARDDGIEIIQLRRWVTAIFELLRGIPELVNDSSRRK